MNVKVNWDKLGITASVACAIHCALLPVFFTTLPLFGINIIENEHFEIFMMVTAFVIGISSFYHGFKHHKSFLPAVVFTTGFIFLLLKLVFPKIEIVLLVPAVVGIVIGHLLNYRACKVNKQHLQKVVRNGVQQL